MFLLDKPTLPFYSVQLKDKTRLKFNNNREKYLFSRSIFREKAKQDFFEYNEHSETLINFTNELVSSLTFFLSKKDLQSIEHGKYISDLIVSFCRTHFICVNLITTSELIDSGILIRKQIELMARLNELFSGLDINKLKKQTPNLKNLQSSLKTVYGFYSEITHSSTPNTLQLLGSTECEGMYFTILYPQFQKNSYVCLQHLIMITLEFYVWCTSFYNKNFKNYDKEKDAQIFQKLVMTYHLIYDNKEN